MKHGRQLVQTLKMKIKCLTTSVHFKVEKKRKKKKEKQKVGTTMIINQTQI